MDFLEKADHRASKENVGLEVRKEFKVNWALKEKSDRQEIQEDPEKMALKALWDNQALLALKARRVIKGQGVNLV